MTRVKSHVYHATDRKNYDNSDECMFRLHYCACKKWMFLYLIKAIFLVQIFYVCNVGWRGLKWDVWSFLLWKGDNTTSIPHSSPIDSPLFKFHLNKEKSHVGKIFITSKSTANKAKLLQTENYTKKIKIYVYRTICKHHGKNRCLHGKQTH